MTQSRRNFLKIVGITAGGAAVVHLIDGPFSLVGRVEAAPLDAAKFKALADLAFKQAKRLGCSYADILVNGYRTGSVSLRTSPGQAFDVTGGLNRFSTVVQNSSFGVQVRALHSRAWGFAERRSVRKAEISSVIAEAVTRAQANTALNERSIVLAPPAIFKKRNTHLRQEDHLDVLINEQIAPVQTLDEGAIRFRTEETYFASTNGSSSRTTRLFWL